MSHQLLRPVLSRPTGSRFRIMLILCGIYLVGALLLLWWLGLLDRVPKLMFSTPDSLTYLRLSDFLVGRTATVNPALVAYRPFLFPLLLSLVNLIGPYGFFMVQLLLNTVSVGLVFATVRRLTASSAVSCLGAALLGASPTFTLAALHALTMSLAIFLVSLTLFFVASYVGSRRDGFLYGALSGVSAATCVKPIFLPFLIVLLGFMIRRLILSRERRPGASVALLLLALSPVLAQLALTARITGRPGISSAGRINFEHRFFPAVHGFAAHGRFVAYTNPAAEHRFPTVGSKLRFIARHPRSALQATVFLLRHNLFSGTPFASSPPVPAQRARVATMVFSWSILLNRCAVALHGAALLTLVWLAVTGRGGSFREFAVLAGILVYSTLILSVLSYWQGDRIITAALPAWAVLYPATAHQVFVRWGKRQKGI